MTEYICLNCLHEWNSHSTSSVLRCSSCHRRQGISYERFRKAVEAVKTAFRKVAESPPPHRPPLEIIGQIPNALGPLVEVARKEFPSPLVPISFFIGILKQATSELRKESSNEEE